MIMKKMKAYIVDDEPANCENLEHLLQVYCPEVEVVKSLTALEEAVEEILAGEIHLLFLDIELAEGTGFDLLARLPRRDFEVIFVTAYDRYALKAIKFNALDYLLKPVDIPALVEAVKKAGERLAAREENVRMENLLKNMAAGEKRIALPLADRIEFVEVQRIIHCRGEGNYTNIQLDDGNTLLVSRPLKEYEELLSDYGFLRVHQSHLVNLREVGAYIKSDGGYIRMKDGVSVPVSRQRKEMVVRVLKEFGN